MCAAIVTIALNPNRPKICFTLFIIGKYEAICKAKLLYCFVLMLNTPFFIVKAAKEYPSSQKEGINRSINPAAAEGSGGNVLDTNKISFFIVASSSVPRLS